MIHLNVKTHYSLCSLSKAEDLIEKTKEFGNKSLGIADINTLGGCVDFFKECKEAQIKPILGYTGQEIFLAKNANDWKELIHSISEERTPQNVICILGAPLSKTYNDLISTFNTEVVSLEDFKTVIKSQMEKLKCSHYFLGIAPDYTDDNKLVNEILIDAGKELGIPTVPICDQYYTNQSDAQDHRVIVCYRSKRKMYDPDTEPEYRRFFESDNYFLNNWTNGGEEVAELCEEYNILSPPKLPHISNPKYSSDEEWVKDICRDGWRKKIAGKPNASEYEKRIKYEFEVFREANLFSYFLIVWDILKWVDEQGWMRGYGRGSAGGCLMSYLMDITKIDPIEYDLMFHRFYSDSRKGSLPDIDSDVEKGKRDLVLQYIIDKYGKDSVCQITTFGQFKGRSALTAVLSAYKACDVGTMKKMTSLFPEESKVKDQMEAVGEDSLILWTLKNIPDLLSQYCRVKEDETLEGDFAQYFATAIRIENTIKDTGKHASAIVILDGKISDICPMINDKSSDRKIAGFSMNDAESVSLVKLDLLGLSTLDRLMLVNEFLRI